MKVAEELLSRAVGGTVFDEIIVLSRFFLYANGKYDNSEMRPKDVDRGYGGFDLDAIL